MVFNSKLGRLTRLITVLVSLLFVVIITSLIIQINDSNRIPLFSLTLALVLVYVLSYLNSPQKLVLESGNLIVKFPMHKIAISKNSILEVYSVDSIPPTNLGSKGVWGYIGWVNGDTKSYVKNRTEAIKLTTHKNQYLLSCLNRELLIKQLKTK